MTELDAINQMLRAIGSDSVNSVTANQPDVANARSTLKRVSEQAQRRGWWFNREYNVTYQPNALKEIEVPSSVESFEAQSRSIILRGKKLYDLENNTYKFDANVIAVETRRNLDWEELPAIFHDYVTFKACAQFVSEELEDTTKIKEFEEEAQRTYIDVMRQDLSLRKTNIMDNTKIAYNRSGVRPYSSRTGRYR